MKFNKSNKGYIAILLVFFIPVILLGTKLILDLHTENTEDVGKAYKKCAKECALEVAKHWNLGLSLKQQKEAMLKVADDVYNNASVFNTMSYKYKAISGLDIPQNLQIIKGGAYDPIQVKPSDDIAASSINATRHIAYEQVPNDWGIVIIGGNRVHLLRPLKAYDTIFKMERLPELVLEDTIQYMTVHTPSGAYDREYMRDTTGKKLYNEGLSVSNGLNNGENWRDPNLKYNDYNTTNYYSKRINPDDEKVKLDIENDKIKVTIDSDTVPSSGYAIPAECNVDIVLGIPTNGAATNINNLDQRTPTTEGTWSNTSEFISNDFRKTPIYQITHELHDLVKNHFYFTRGTNIGIVPYCGQCSIDPDKMDTYTVHPPRFTIDYFSSDQNTYQNYVRQCFMYSAWAWDQSLTYYRDNDYGLTSYSGTNIYARIGNSKIEPKFGNNTLFYGDLLSTEDPTKSNNQKFLRFSADMLNGTASNTNLLSGKYDNGTSAYWSPNPPFYIIELQSDLLRITDMLNCIGPFPRNQQLNSVSNFLFIPITWANNLFQSWTNDPKYEAKDTASDSENLGRLSQPSKSDSNRKKAVILIANKPDWFEPGELTYLGYDNDFSEIPAIESDTIKFDINYSDTSKKFADNSSFDGTIQGPKKILKFTATSGNIIRNVDSEYYECTSATGQLSFPQKYLVKIVVEPIMQEVKLLYPTSTSSAGSGGGWVHSISFVNNKLFVVTEAGYILTSTDGEIWSAATSGLTELRGATSWNYIWTPMYYANGKYGICGCRGYGATSTDGNSWSTNSNLSSLYNTGNDVRGCYQTGNTIIYCTREGVVSRSTDGGNTWDAPNNVLSSLRNIGGREIWTICGINNKVIAFSGGYTSISADGGISWSSPSNNLKDLYSRSNDGYIEAACYANDKFIAVTNNGYCSTSTDGISWSSPVRIVAPHINSICRSIYAKNKLFLLSGDDGIVYFFDDNSSKVKFTNIAAQTNGTTTEEYNITERKEFYIEPDQIQAGSDGNYYIDFDMENIRLISAEITNRPYEKIIPSCSISGITNGTGTACININCKNNLKMNIRTFEGKATFYDIDDTIISDATVNSEKITSGSPVTVYGTQTFTFPASCFSSKYNPNSSNPSSSYVFSLNKLKYNLDDAYISSAILKNQMLRIRGKRYRSIIDYYDPSLTMYYYHPGGDAGGGGWTCLWGTDRYFRYTLSNPWIKKAKLAICYYVYSGCQGILKYIDEDNNSKEVTLSTGTQTQNYTLSIPSDGIFCYVQGGSSGYNTIVYWLQLYNLDDCVMNMNNFSDTSTGLYITDDNTINFEGQGDLIINIAGTKTGSIKYTNYRKELTSCCIERDQELTISPATHYYEKQSDGTYKIKLDIENIQLSDLKLIDTSYVFEYTNLPSPEMSRVVDFSKNINGSPEYNSTQISQVIFRKLVYDNDLGYWRTNEDNYPYSEFYNNNIIGDFYSIIEDIGTSTQQLRFFNRSKGPETFRNVKNELYNFNGLYRLHQAFSETRRAEMSSFDLPLSSADNPTKYIMAGFTLPVNNFLYWGASGNDLHKYQWQSDKEGNLTTYAPTEAVKKVTVDACKKLKSDWGSNIRLYLIKYRKQTQYKHPVTDSAINFDYNYMNDCASDTKAPYMYDISTKEDLKSALNSIASDIKTWAGYKEARNVEKDEKI